MLIHSYLSDKVRIRKSEINKKGIFAVKPIKKDEILSVYGGYIITRRQYKQLAKNDFKHIGDYAIEVAEGFYLVSSKKGRLEDDDFFNHSCNPNAGIKGHLIMAAMRDIHPKEEITYDYAMTDAGIDYNFKCSCLSKDCRKVITGGDWQIKRLQRKYKGYISWFVQEKVDSFRISRYRKV